MTIPAQIDHVELGLSRLPSQWVNSEKLQGLLTSFLNRSNDLEDTLFQLLNERGIFEAAGVQLDNIGALFGEDREGRVDSEYRQAILTQIVLTDADGTTEVFMQALRTITNSNYVNFWEHFSGDIHVLLGDGFTAYTYEDIKAQAPAAVSVRIYLDDKFDSFMPSEIIQTDSVLQVDDGNGLQDLEVDNGVEQDVLEVQYNSIALGGIEQSILPEINDSTGTPYLAELLFTKVLSSSGNIVANTGEALVDNNTNNIIWLDYNF